MNATTQNGLTVANTIMAQLGGGRFVAMTGAKDIIAVQGGVKFTLPRGGKLGINIVIVTLDVSDTYTVKFYKRGRRPTGGGIAPIDCMVELDGVYADSLRAVFTEHTGFHTSLGTMGGK